MLKAIKAGKLYQTQQNLIILLFVSAILIFLDLGIFSISFIFGILLIGYSSNRAPLLLKPSGIMWFLFAFLGIALISMLLADLSITAKEVKKYIQTIYWFLLAVIVYKAYPAINKNNLSKYLLFSIVLLLLLFFVGFRIGMSQNAVAFSVIICAPLSYFYLHKLWQKTILASLLIFLMLLNGSRSGAIISFIQSVMIISFSIPVLVKYFKSFLIIIALFFLLFNVDPIRVALGNAIAPYNHRLGMLMKNPDFVLQNDMSWLQRKAQVQKGKQIFAKHPVLGIGYLNFSRIEIAIDQSKISKDRKIRNIDNRSAHNAYIALLSETGILGFSTFLLFFLIILFRFWKNIKDLGNTFEAYVLISFIGLLIYFYSISSLLGTSSWIMYGLIAGASHSVKNGLQTKYQLI